MDRRILPYSAVLAALAYAQCVTAGDTPVAAQPDPRGAQAEAPATVTQIAPGVYVRAGHAAVVFEDDDIANVGFVVGERCVAVIDSGGSDREAHALQLAIRSVTTLPVCFVVNTHAHPDHSFGSKPFADAGAEVVGHAKLARALGQRAEIWLKRASARAGRTLVPGDLAIPTVPVATTMELDLGNRALSLTAHPSAHTDNDLTVYDAKTGTLWAGDLLFVGHVPVLDGSINGWIDVLRALEGVAAERAVPGHGPPAVPWPGAAADTLRYLMTLRDDVRQRIAAGDDLRGAQEAAGYTEAPRWQLFDEYHARNVAAAWTELEWE